MFRIPGRETLLFGLLLCALAAWGFRFYASHRAAAAEAEAARVVREITETAALRRFWDGKGLGKKLLRLKADIPAAKIRSYEIANRKAHIRLEGIEGRRLNRLLDRLGGLPVRFVFLSVSRRAEHYDMECRCLW